MLNSNLETELKAISTTQVKKRRKSFKSFRTGGSGLAAHKEEPDDGGTGAGAGAGSAERGGSEGPVGGRGIARKPPSSIKLDDPSDVQSLGEAIGIGRAAFFNPDGWTVDEASGTAGQILLTLERTLIGGAPPLLPRPAPPNDSGRRKFPISVLSRSHEVALAFMGFMLTFAILMTRTMTKASSSVGLQLKSGRLSLPSQL